LEDHQILLELSYFDLEGRTNTIMGGKRKENSNKVQVNNLTFIPFPSNNKLKVGSNTTSNNGHDYWTSILFDNIEYLEEGEPNGFTFTANDGSEYTIARVRPNVNVKVTCSCLDFHYRFAVWDDKFRALDGNPPPPYIKTSNRPSVNPMQSPGLCKHLIKMVNNLKAQNFFA
jgi:uncharacterized surface anchored protein